MLEFTLRVRDLVHGTIYFTDLERRVINHPFFQRLRHVRQNDVAFYVYPSVNTSRFEHVLGTSHVASKMAEHLGRSPLRDEYLDGLKKQAGIESQDEFVQLVSLYALLHDIGHLPLSHLFEMAATEYWISERQKRMEAIKEWTNTEGFEKLHEAFGAKIINELASDPAIGMSGQTKMHSFSL
ncbi:MAG TPA: HD domain-containing protein [Candidatus Paceibacterota bacterium]|jgi:HD superfamily phosphohydrolase|nr:HD domain-containing protein [Candidatus Paceibacterota bacterium]